MLLFYGHPSHPEGGSLTWSLPPYSALPDKDFSRVCNRIKVMCTFGL